MFDSIYKNIIKRILDVLFAFLILIILLPPILIICICIKIDSKGPIIYKQLRTGKNGKNFILYKFRSMSTTSNDIMSFDMEETTGFGKILRKTNLDELPQLINIIKGDMSFIGPRPWIVQYYELFNKKQKRRVEVLPGITGLAQCNGKNNISIQKKISYDIYYIDNLSFMMDLKILFKTFKILKLSDINSMKLNIKKELEQLRKQNKKRSR